MVDVFFVCISVEFDFDELRFEVYWDSCVVGDGVGEVVDVDVVVEYCMCVVFGK